MRAWQVRGAGDPAEVLELVDIEPPEPGPGEVRLRVEAAAVGLPDVFMCRGTYPLTPAGVFVAGQEVCGVVDAVGAGVGSLAVGDRCMAVTNFYDGRGGFAECTIVRPESAHRVPGSMTAEEAAAFRIGFSTGWIGLVRRGRLAAGETLLVLGAAGGSGITAVQIGHALGARVLAVATGPERGRFCVDHGADRAIDRSVDDVVAVANEVTGGAGVDVVYDPVGGDLADATVGCLSRDGRLLAVGFASGRWVSPNVHALVRRNASLVGVYAGGLGREADVADHEALLDLWEQGHLRAQPTVMAFDDLPAALDAVRTNQVLGKVVVRP